MSKEELEKEAKEYVCKRNPLVTKEWFIDAFKKYDKGEKVKYLKDCEIAEYEAYLAGAEPREKQIEVLEELLDDCGDSINEFREKIKSLGERCLQLQKDKGNLTDRVRELEAQIEKMKCCGNCARFCECRSRGDVECKNRDKWELRR